TGSKACFVLLPSFREYYPTFGSFSVYILARKGADQRYLRMSVASPSDERKQVEALLKRLRDTPIGSGPETEPIINEVYKFLMQIPACTPDGVFHWFCHRAEETTREAAAFLLRLFAYNSPRVEAWKTRMKSTLAACCDCVEGLQKAKIMSQDTYFGHFEDAVFNNFMHSFNEWELHLVLDGLSHVPITPEPPALVRGAPPPTLSDAPHAFTYHMLINLHILQDPRINVIIKTRTPSAFVQGWPSGSPPPGLFYLLLHEEESVRLWAKSQMARYQKVPMAKDIFVGPYMSVFDTLTELLSHDALVLEARHAPVPFTQDPAALWKGISAWFRQLPPELYKSRTRMKVDLSHLLAGHLHDTGLQFPEILRCFVYLVRRSKGDLWKNDAADYPQVLFDAIKDNPSYSEHVQSLSPSEEKPWSLLWFYDYLQTISNSSIFGDVLAKMVDFLCEELQHERFQDARPIVMIAATALLRAILDKRRQGEEYLTRQGATLNALDIHVDRFVAVAFSRAYGDSKWVTARKSVRGLINLVLEKDVQAVSDCIAQLCSAFAGRQTEISVPIIRRPLWKKTYDGIQANDSEAITMIVTVIAPSAHMNTLNSKAFDTVFKARSDSFSPSTASAAFGEVNSSLAIFRDGFSDAILKYANYNTSSSCEALLRRPGFVRDVMALMLCPVEDIQSAAQTLVGQAFDVDVRSDCFRALFTNLPDSSLRAVLDYMETFTPYVSTAPEACDLSKAFVRCLTDVVEVLCSHPDGLLLDEAFLRRSDGPGPSAELPKMWTLMTQAIATIFRRTPSWSLFFESEDMIVWMRDALIFGRDLLAQWRVFEAAATAHSEGGRRLSTTTRKLSRVGRKMVDDLQQVLTELARWLRLTDAELLHQSFALLESLLDCFRETHTKPSKTGMDKLNSHITNAREQDPRKQDRPKSRLDTARLEKLEDALASFIDDDIEIISHTLPPPEKMKRQDTTGREPVTGSSSKSLRQSSLSFSKMSGSSAPSRQASSKVSSSPYFSAQDQKKLDAEESMAPRPKMPTTLKTSASLGSVASTASVAKTESRKQAPKSSHREDSDDDDDDYSGGLASLTEFQRPQAPKKPPERRQMKVLDLPTNVKGSFKTRNEKDRRGDARRIAMRMKPDISGLHRTILSWPYDSTGSDPPNWDKRPPLIYVPDKFSDHDQYRRIFEPLLLLECWAQLLQSKDEPKESYECKITSRQFIDDWVDLDLLITEPLKKGWFLSETDIVLLRHPISNQSVLARALSFKATFFGQQGVQASLRSYPGRGSEPGPQINSTWRISKVFSLSTLHREYAALVAMPLYDFANFILQPQLSRPPSIDQYEIRQAMASYNVNEPQARAIASSLRTEGFSLIQGPPGTGKTSTICGLVQAYLSNRQRAVTSVNVGRQTGPPEKAVSKKILLCAPSNAAIDEIAHRLKEGVSGAGRRSNSIPKVVRVGADKALNISVRDISLDSLVDQKMDAQKDAKGSPKDAGNEIAVLRNELESVRKLKLEKQTELMELHDNAAKSIALEEEIRKLNHRRMTLTQQVDRLKDKQKSDYRTLDATRRKFRQEVLNEADVICSTLSGAGHDILEQLDFDMIIIDEAAQAIELSTLIPLKYRCVRCVMVGDPQQLPPTVISQEASKYLYNQSLFVRFQKHHPDAVHLLSIQYRMHPDISQLPSRVFYKGRLEDGPDMAAKTTRPWHTSPRFAPYRFFNVARGQEASGPSHSLMNKAEVQVAVALYARLKQEFASVDFDSRVGVVSMYRAQIVELRRAFEQRFGAEILSQVDFNTVDGFQGQEKDVIILSCVRAGPGLQSVGFLSDMRRMNVALTRARASLFVLGHCPTLERSDETWKQIISDARTRSYLIDVCY
ncbi:hypothetical protein BV25DRAFT_1948064, partial [Artomyces pyxidatus]